MFYSPDQKRKVSKELNDAEADEWEIAVDRVQLQEVIGRGAFSRWKAWKSDGCCKMLHS